MSAAAAEPESLLVVRLGAMGDIIHTLPAVTALRNALPNARIGWIVEERWAELLCAKDSPRSGARSPSRPLADFVHAVDTKTWRKSLLSRETQRQISSSLREVRDLKYEIAVDFQGALKSAVIATLRQEHAPSSDWIDLAKLQRACCTTAASPQQRLTSSSNITRWLRPSREKRCRSRR